MYFLIKLCIHEGNMKYMGEIAIWNRSTHPGEIEGPWYQKESEVYKRTAI